MQSFSHPTIIFGCTTKSGKTAENFRRFMCFHSIERIWKHMETDNTLNNAMKFACKHCNFICGKKSDYDRHIRTNKHVSNTEGNNKTPKVEPLCKHCNRRFKTRSGLWKHMKKCDNQLTISDKSPRRQTKDGIIDKLVEELNAEREEKSEMKSMFMLMMEKYQEIQMQNQENTREILKETARGNKELAKGNQELVNKVIEVIPRMGNTTNNTTNNTLNFYLTNTCKDAESIHDFTDRYVKRCTDFFIENYRSIANNQMCLASNVYNIMFKCLEENPQYMNFIQTTDIKNGVHYVKEKRKDENRQLYGEAEFIKYVDGFEKAGARIGHAINKSFFPLKTEFALKLEQEVGLAPNEDEYEDDDEYEDALDRYKTRKREASCSLQTNVCNTMSLFDSNTRKLDILKKTKRAREDDMKIDNL